MRKWKLDPETGDSLIKKFKDEYNLTFEEAAKATGLKTPKAFKDIMEDANKADGVFIDKLHSLSGISPADMFTYEFETLNQNSDFFLEENHISTEIQKIKDDYFKTYSIFDDKHYLYSAKLNRFKDFHKPIITFCGDAFSGKNKIISDCMFTRNVSKETIDRLNSYFELQNKKNFPIYLVDGKSFSDKDFLFPSVSIISKDENFDSATAEILRKLQSIQHPEFISEINISILGYNFLALNDIKCFLDQVRNKFTNIENFNTNFNTEDQSRIEIAFMYSNRQGILLTPENHYNFEPSLLEDSDYIKSCLIEEPVEKNVKGNSVLLMAMDSELLKDSIILILPDIKYTKTDKEFNAIKQESINSLLRYIPFSDIIVWFDAISRFLTIHETSLIHYLLHNYNNGKKVLLTATKLSLNTSLVSQTIYSEIQKKETAQNYSGVCSFDIEKSSIGNFNPEKIDSLIFFYNEIENSAFQNKLNDFCNEYLDKISTNITRNIKTGREDILNTISEEKDSLPPEEIIEQVDESFKQISRDLKNAIIETFEISSLEEILKSKGKDSSYCFDDFIFVIYSISRSILKHINFTKLNIKYDSDKLLKIFDLYIGNILYPMFRREKNFSKGTSTTWAKKIHKEFIKPYKNGIEFKKNETAINTEDSIDILITNIIESIKQEIRWYN